MCGLMYLMTWLPVCQEGQNVVYVPGDLAACLPGGPEPGFMYLVTWPPVCQEGQCVD